jgi:cytochrome b561
MLRNTAHSWGGIARLLHWLIAALMLAQVVLGWWAVSQRLSPLKLNLFVWHKSIGIVILVLALARILWRVTNVTPGLPVGTRAWERHAAHWNHALLYLVLVAMPVTGWIVNSASGVPFRIFWLAPLPPIVAHDKAVADAAAAAHFWLFALLCALVFVHEAAALRHHFVKRNDVLARMLHGAGDRP